MARDIRWSELPTGGALRHARGAIGGALLAFPLLLAFGGLFAAADPVFRNVVATALHVDFSAVASHLALTAFWTALTTGYFWGALIRRAPPPAAADAQALSLGIVPVGTALGLVNLLFLVFVVIQLRYFFGGAELVQSATDLTYAEYARRGSSSSSPPAAWCYPSCSARTGCCATRRASTSARYASCRGCCSPCCASSWRPRSSGCGSTSRSSDCRRPASTPPPS